ncbi:hypothetical protein Tco_1319334 [Tanacetum coccineum]
MQSPPQNLQKGSCQPKGEHIKKDKGKKAMSSKDPEEVSTKSDSNDETTHVPGSIKIKEEAKAEAARRDGEMRKEELINLLGLEVMSKYYNDKLQYDKYCDKMPNRRTESRITNYDILTRKGQITLEVYREDDTTEIIPEFIANSLHLIAEVSSASALQVLRILGNIFTSVYAVVQKLKKDSWKELQFSLVDNSKLNIVYLLNRS